MPRGGSEPTRNSSDAQLKVLLVCGFGVVEVTEIDFGLCALSPRRRNCCAGDTEPAEQWAGGLLVLQSKIDLHLRKARWQQFLLFFALLLALAALSSCGSSTS